MLAATVLVGCTASGKVEVSGYRSDGDSGSGPPPGHAVASSDPGNAEHGAIVKDQPGGWSARRGPQDASSGGDIFVVRNGDTLSGIAKAHGVTVEMIYSANGLLHDRLTPGQHLVVPRPGKYQGRLTAQ